MNRAIDNIQQRLTDYACGLSFNDLSSDAIHAAKARIIDTLGVLVGGFFGESCMVLRSLAAQMPDPHGATVIGTRMKTMPDLAAFVNAATARALEFNDLYHWPGSAHGHPSDVITPVLAAAEYAKSNGRELITAVVLAYEVYCRISDVFRNPGFCTVNFATLSSAVAAGWLLGLSPAQLAHCISMAIVPNVILKQVRFDHLSMFKTVGAGQAGRAGVFAALLARAGMEGPHLPFEGKAGWCRHVAGGKFSLDAMGGNGTAFKISDTWVRHRPCMSEMIASILAAEKVFRNLGDIKAAEKVTVEVNKRAKESVGTGPQLWNPDSRQVADHSIPYVVAATLIDGTLSLHSFDEAHLRNLELRALIQKIEVLENEEFTQAYKQVPRKHQSRVTVLSKTGQRIMGQSGGDQDDLSAPRNDMQIVEKFETVAGDLLGTKRITAILDRLWNLDNVENVGEISEMFVFC